jgi:hypothetical protein
MLKVETVNTGLRLQARALCPFGKDARFRIADL